MGRYTNPHNAAGAATPYSVDVVSDDDVTPLPSVALPITPAVIDPVRRPGRPRGPARSSKEIVEAYHALRDAAAGRNPTQQQLADRLGKPQSFISKYEGGERRIDVIEFITISEALQMDASRAIREIRAKFRA